MRKLDRLRLFLFCFFEREQPTILRLLLYLVVHSLTCNPVETMAAPSKARPVRALRGFFHLRHVLMVELAGVEPASRIIFFLLHTTISKHAYTMSLLFRETGLSKYIESHA